MKDAERQSAVVSEKKGKSEWRKVSGAGDRFMNMIYISMGITSDAILRRSL